MTTTALTPVAAAARAAACERLYSQFRNPRDLLDAARHRYQAGYLVLAATLAAALSELPGTPHDIATAARSLHRQALASLPRN